MAAPPPTVDPAHLPPGYMTENNSRATVAASVVFLVATTVAYGLRLTARQGRKKSVWGWDDTLLVPAYVFNLGVCTIGLVGASNGNVGRHFAALLIEGGPKATEPVFKVVWALGWVWFPATALPKLAILALYLRIFPQIWVRRTAWAMIAFVSANCLGCLVASAFMCVPLQAWWDHTITGKCFNFIAFFIAVNVPHVTADLIIMLIPLPLLARLNMSWGRRAGVIFIFAAGSMGIIGSCYRLSLFAMGKESPGGDITWGAADGITWSIIEPGMCFVAACVLAMGQLPDALRNLASSSAVRSLLSRVTPSKSVASSNSAGHSNGSLAAGRAEAKGPRTEWLALGDRNVHTQGAISDAEESVDGEMAGLNGIGVKRDVSVTLSNV